MLLEAKETLVDESKRNKYDFWLNSGINISWKEWLKLNNGEKPVFHWIIKKQEPMIESNQTKDDDSINACLKSFRQSGNRFNHNDDTLNKFRNYKI